MKATVLGTGAWGTALACLLADAGHATTLWGRDAEVLRAMAERRRNDRYLPGRRLPDSLRLEADLDLALAPADLCVVALPSAALRGVLAAARARFRGLVACASKGLERGSGRTLDAVVAEVWPEARVALLSGPTFAVELAQGKPAAAVVASRDPEAARAVQEALSGGPLRVYTSPDVVGVAVGGALKNVIAIAAGCSDALGFGCNARAALITRGLHEALRLAERLGGDPLTLAGLAGLGDLVLTCTGELSRNRTVGFALGRGERLAAVTARLGQVTEGVETAETALALAARAGVELPIVAQVAAVLAGAVTPREAVEALLSREVTSERG